MSACRTIEQVRAAAREAVAGLPPLSQDAADQAGAILASREPRRAAA